MISREKQAEFFVKLIMKEHRKSDKVFILGCEFKPETNLAIGSHAFLVANILDEVLPGGCLEIFWKQDVHDLKPVCGRRSIFFIGCKHESFKDLDFPTGSVIVDPFRFIPDKPGCKVIRIGE
jgi:UDPglucose 6-dehydrogenase